MKGGQSGETPGYDMLPFLDISLIRKFYPYFRFGH
jgi:hypothetical protein